MLDKVDLSLKMDREDFETGMPELENDLARLQRQLRAEGVPLCIVFEGWDAIGMGYIVNRIIHPLDKRGLDYHFMGEPCELERERPFLWRFAMRTPARGRIAIFDKSWYSRAVHERWEGKGGIDPALLAQMTRFERQLHDDGTAIVKLFLHVSWKEKMRLLETFDDDLIESLGLSRKRLKDQKLHKRALQLIDMMMEATDCDYAPWEVVASEDRHHAVFWIMTILRSEMQRALVRSRDDGIYNATRQEPFSSVRDTVDLTRKMGRGEYERRLVELQARLRELQTELYIKGTPLMVVFEGWDAAGKGGNISRLTRNLNPRTYSVVPVQAPTEIEKAHHYLRRFMERVPCKGHMTIYDRSWYGRVLVERVEGLATEEEWRRAYREINEFEEMLAEEGWTIVKLWLEIDRDEQLRRFEKRRVNPEKEWKITDEDWRNRERWDLYSVAVDEMLLRTSTTFAPWTIVEANDKPFARIKVLETVADTMERVVRSSTN